MSVINSQSDVIDINKKKYIAAFYIIFTIGLVCLTHRIGELLGSAIANYLNSSIQYRAWAMTCLEVAKPSELMSYLLPAFCLAFYYFLACLHLNGYIKFKNKLLLAESPTKKIVLYGILAVVTNLFLLLRTNYHLGLIIWIALFIFPFIKMQATSISKKYIPLGWCALFILLIFQSITILWPYGFIGVPLISNDYMDIPEQTLVNQQLVDNISFINQHRIGGLLKYDPRLPATAQQQLVAGEDYIKLPKTNPLLHFIEMHHDAYQYDDSYQGLFVNQPLTSTDSDALCQLSGNENNCKAITHYYQFQSLLNKRSYNSQELMFIQFNEYEIDTQAVAGHYFHHHNAFLGPINDYHLGKSPAQTMFLYGWLNTVVLSKLLSHSGIISFADYLKTTYLFYPLYFLLIALSAVIIFRNFGIVFIIVLISSASVFAMGFESIHLAPGFNPIRHFFDLFVLLFWYGYLFARRNNTLYLGLAVVFCIIAFLASKEFGFFLFIGLLVTYFLRILNGVKPKLFEILAVLLGIFALSIAFLTIKIGANPNAIYYLSGVTIPPTSKMEILVSLCIICVTYIFLFLRKWKDDRWRFLAIFLFIYLQLSLIYYIWYSDRGHLLIFAAGWSFLGVILFRELLSNVLGWKKIENYVIALVAAWVLVTYYIPLTATYLSYQYKYLAIFKNHKIYDWNIPTAKFYSTMDPEPFYDAIRLINKYSNGNGIYIISKYDNSLPFFAEKYNQMPFLQTDLSIVSHKELQIGINSILSAKPEYLFVDSDIDRKRQGDIYWPKDPLVVADMYELSRGRAMVLDNLSTIFDAVRPYYQPLERGQLITVYKLKR